MKSSDGAIRVVGVYLRVSTDEQREKQSIATQREYAIAYCERTGLTIYAFYEDDGVSGSIPFHERPAGARLLADAAAGRFESVLVYMYDRFSRDVLEGLLAARTLKQSGGVGVMSMTEPFDLNDPHGAYMFTQSLNNAQLWKDQMLQRSMAGTLRVVRAGQWVGGIVPYGYRVEGVKQNARLVPSDDLIPGLDMSEADVVRLIYFWLAEEGRSCFWIADQLTSLGVSPAYLRDGREVRRNTRKAATAGIWRPARIRNLVVNTTYKGIHQYGKSSAKAAAKAKKGEGSGSGSSSGSSSAGVGSKNGVGEVIERAVPALVSVEVWERAQETLRRNQILATRSARYKYLLRGLIKCGLCGLTYIGTGYKLADGHRKAYYVCNGKHGARGLYGEKGSRCPSKSVKAEEIENAIWADIESFLRDPEAALQQIHAKLIGKANDAQQFREESARLLTVADEKTREKDAVIALFRRGRIDAATLDRQLDDVQAEENKLRQQAAGLAERARGADDLGRQLQIAGDFLREVGEALDGPLTWEQKRRAVEVLVDSVVVETIEAKTQRDKEAQVRIRYCFERSKTPTVIHTGTDSSRRRG